MIAKHISLGLLSASLMMAQACRLRSTSDTLQTPATDEPGGTTEACNITKRNLELQNQKAAEALAALSTMATSTSSVGTAAMITIAAAGKFPTVADYVKSINPELMDAKGQVKWKQLAAEMKERYTCEADTCTFVDDKGSLFQKVGGANLSKLMIPIVAAGGVELDSAAYVAAIAKLTAVNQNTTEMALGYSLVVSTAAATKTNLSDCKGVAGCMALATAMGELQTGFGVKQTDPNALASAYSSTVAYAGVTGDMAPLNSLKKTASAQIAAVAPVVDAIVKLTSAQTAAEAKNAYAYLETLRTAKKVDFDPRQMAGVQAVYNGPNFSQQGITSAMIGVNSMTLTPSAPQTVNSVPANTFLSPLQITK